MPVVSLVLIQSGGMQTRRQREGMALHCTEHTQPLQTLAKYWGLERGAGGALPRFKQTYTAFLQRSFLSDISFLIVILFKIFYNCYLSTWGVIDTVHASVMIAQEVNWPALVNLSPSWHAIKYQTIHVTLQWHGNGDIRARLFRIRTYFYEWGRRASRCHQGVNCLQTYKKEQNVLHLSEEAL